MGTQPFVARTKMPPAVTKVPKQRLSAAERLRRLEEAKAFLHQHLATNPQPAQSVLKAATAAGIATRTLSRAKAALGVQVRRDGWGKQGRWVWLPLIAAPLGEKPPMMARRKKVLQETERR